MAGGNERAHSGGNSDRSAENEPRFRREERGHAKLRFNFIRVASLVSSGVVVLVLVLVAAAAYRGLNDAVVHIRCDCEAPLTSKRLADRL